MNIRFRNEENNRTSQAAIWSLVLGILGCVCCAPAGIAAIPIGIAGLSACESLGLKGAGIARAGIVCGCVSILILALNVVLLASRAA